MAIGREADKKVGMQVGMQGYTALCEDMQRVARTPLRQVCLEMTANIIQEQKDKTRIVVEQQVRLVWFAA